MTKINHEKKVTNCNEIKIKKTLICIADIANSGKTETAENVIDILKNTIGSTIVYKKKGFSHF